MKFQMKSTGEMIKQRGFGMWFRTLLFSIFSSFIIVYPSVLFGQITENERIYFTASAPSNVYLPSGNSVNFTVQYATDGSLPDPSDFDRYYWSLHTSEDGYWNGSAWQSGVYRAPVQNNSVSFWSNGSIDATSASLIVPGHFFDDLFWNGHLGGSKYAIFSLHYDLGNGSWTKAAFGIYFSPDPEIHLSGVSPDTLIFPLAGNTMNLDLGYTLSDFAQSAVNQNYYWQVYHPLTGDYWDGDAWTSTEVIQPVVGGNHPFWGNGTINSNTITLNADVSSLDPDFWGLDAIKSLKLRIFYDYDGLWVRSEVPFTVFNDFIQMTNLTNTSFSITPGVQDQAAFSFDVAESHPDPNASGSFKWTWQRADGLYWTGSEWQIEPEFVPLLNAAPFWGQTSFDGSHLSASFDVPSLADTLWNGIEEIYIQVYWWKNGINHPDDETITLSFDWQTLPAPDAGPLGTVYDSTPVVSWDALVGADAYSIQTYLPGAFSEASFLNETNLHNSPHVTSGTSLALVDGLDEQTTYEVYGATKKGNSWGPIVLLGTVYYDPPVFTYGSPGALTADVNFNTLDQVNISPAFLLYQRANSLSGDVKLALGNH